MLKLTTHFLNKYLSPYVKNIDESKLKLQLTSGSVALENIELVETVLDELDIPLRVVSGQLKRLTLKVPWHKIYSSPTVVTIDGLYVLLAPKSEVAYDADKERDQVQNEKMKQVKLFEQRAQEKKESTNEAADAKSLGTLEKLAMTVVKNLQIRVNNIHIRYEDGFSVPGTVLAVGVMLDSLSFDSANERFEPKLVEELSERFFKLVQLKNFSVYLNVPLAPSDRYSPLAAYSIDRLNDKMLADIVEMGTKPAKPSHSFLISPFSAAARLKLNTRPEITSYRESRVSLELDLDAFSLGISQKQYRTVIEIVDAVDYIKLQYKYRKFRPHIPCRGKGGAREWWIFAINCVISDHRGLFYSASKMLEFLRVCKLYRQLYYMKLTKKSLSDDVAKQLSACEEKLDAFNIVLQRRQAELEAKRNGLLQPPTSSSSGSWMSSIFSWRRESSPSNEPSTAGSLAKQLDEALTPEDRAQLMKSLGLDEEGNDQTDAPPEYVAFRIGVSFQMLEVKCYGSLADQQNSVAHFVLSSIATNIALRANKSMKIAGQFRRLQLYGVDGVSFAEAPAPNSGGHVASDTLNLLSFEFDSKTLDSGDQSLMIESQPLSIVYHAATVNRLREFFTLPPNTRLQAVSELAANAAEDLKEKSVGFIKTILDDRPFVDIRVSLRGGYVVFPEKGDLSLAKRVMVADLGVLSIHAEPKRSSSDVSIDFDQLDTSKSSKQQQAVLRELMNSAYNRFSISVEPIQVFLCNADEDWQSARGKPAGDLHLLPPLQIRALFGLCIITDPRLPATSLDFAIHPANIVIDIRDTRLRSAVLLLASIPFESQQIPSTAAADEVVAPPRYRRMSSLSSDRGTDLGRSGGGNTRQALAQLSSSTQLTPTGKPANVKLFAVSFNLNQLTCQLTDSEAAVLVRVVVGQLKFQMNVDTYTISGGMTIHSFHFQHQRLTSSPVSRPIHNIVNTSVTLVPTSTSFAAGLTAVPVGVTAERSNLLSIRFLYADPLGPDFDTTHQRRRVQLSIRVGAVELLLHREAILDVIRLAGTIADAASAASQTKPGEQKGRPQIGGLKKKTSSNNSLHASLLSLADDVGSRLGESPTGRKLNRHVITPTTGRGRIRRRPEITHLYIDAKLDRISAVLRTEAARFGSLQIGGLAARIATKLLSTTIDASLTELGVFSSVSSAPEDTRQTLVLAATTSDSSHPTTGTEIVSAKLTIYNPSQDQSVFVDVESADIVIEAKLAQLRMVVVQHFVEGIIEYALGFGDNVANRVKEASSSVAQSAKAGIQQIHDEAKKIKFDIAISSPVIIIPRTPTETHAFFGVHLGSFRLSNEFVLRSQDEHEAAIAEARAKLTEVEDNISEQEEAALLNCLTCELAGVKLVRGWTDTLEDVVEANLDINCQLPLIAPISLSVNLTQNLSASVDPFSISVAKFADFKIVLNLTNIEVSMCQGDYIMLLDVVEWISNTKFSPPKNEDVSASEKLQMSSAITQETSSATVYHNAQSNLDVPREATKEKSPVLENRKVLDVSCRLQKVLCQLYSGDVDFSEFNSSHSAENAAQIGYSSSNLLTSLSITDVQASFVVIGNQNKVALFSLANMTVDDTRPTSKGLAVTRLIECFNQLSAMKINPLVPQKPPRLFVFKFEEFFDKQARSLHCDVNNLHACVNAEFVVQLANFFTSNKKSGSSPAKPTSSVQAPANSQLRDREATAALMPSFSTRLSLKLSNPKFLLLDDPTSLKPNALALQLDISSDLIIHEQNIAGAAAINDFAIFWGLYENLKTGDVDFAQRLLKPMTLTVTLNDTANSEEAVSRLRKLDISSSDFSLSVTPPAIRTISVVAQELSAIGGTPATQQPSVSSYQISESIWNHRPLDSFKLDFLRRSDSAIEALNLLGEEEQIEKKALTTELTIIIANFPSVTFKLSTGSKRKIVPLVKMRSSVAARASAFSTGAVNATLQFDVEVAYYNDQSYIWEPLLEPVECTVPGMPLLYTPPGDVPRHRRAIFNIELTRNVTHQVADSEMPASNTMSSGIAEIAEEEAPAILIPKAVTNITIQTSDILQLVVTKIGLGVLTTVGQVFSKAYHAEEAYTSDSSDVKSLYPVILFNHTDTKFTVRPDSSLVCARVVGGDQTSSSSGSSGHSQHITLTSNSFAALDFNVSNSAHLTARQQPSTHQPSTSTAVAHNRNKNVAKLLTYEDQRSYKFTIYADEYRSTKELIVKRADSILYRVSPVGSDATVSHHAFVCQITASEGNMVVEFTSVVKVTNNLLESVGVFCRQSVSQANPSNVLTLQPGRTGYLPLKSIYGTVGGFYMKPLNENYEISTNAIELKQKQKSVIITCPSGVSGESPFLISAFIEILKVEAEKQQTSGFILDKEEMFHLHIMPVVTIKNVLPCVITITEMSENGSHELVTYTLDAGRQHPLRHCSIPNSTFLLKLPSYCGETWMSTVKTGTVCLTKNTYVPFNATSKRLDLPFFLQVQHGAVILSLYSPYWFVNRTGMALSYRVLDTDTVFDHSEAGVDPLLVSVPSKNTTKRKIQLKVGESDWSEKFSIDTVGSAGTCVCKFRNSFNYNVGLKIVLASCKLTKIITLTPFFFIVNKCPYDIQCQETIPNAKVHTLYRGPPDQVIPFWPMETDVAKQRMTITVKETGQTSVPFPFALQDNMLLKFDAPIYGINVACYICEGAIHITFEPYSDGLAPVLVVNGTHRMQLEYFQEKAQVHELLDAKEGALFTWPDPALEKNFQWAPYDIGRRICVRPTLFSKAKSVVTSPTSPSASTRLLPTTPSGETLPNSSSSSSICSDIPPATKYYSTDVTKDGAGSFQADPDTKVWWVCFMHRKQRVLFFTEDQELARSIQEEQGELEQKNLEVILKIAAVGLSLVDNSRRTELIYAAITPSAVDWQYRRKRSYKTFSAREASLLENAYDQYERKKVLDPNNAADSSHVVLDNGKFEADLEKMFIKRGDQTIEIRRVCQDGIWLNAGFSDYHSHFHFKLNRIQVDNQTPDSRFQTVLAPVPPPKSVAADSTTPKSFVELSLLLRKQADSQMLLFKYFKVLIQEMAVQVDLPFLLQLASFFILSPGSLEEDYELFRHDLEHVALPLEKTDLGPELSGGQKHFFELLHISPLKIHLSFSPQGGSGSSANALDENAVAIGDVGTFFLSSIGTMTGDVTDAIFRLGYYQQNSALMTIPQVANSMQSHYTQQALRQFFNVLLGFDVIGNPVGVLRGFASGVETLFYEPWQGAIQGPEELAIGVAIGLQQFFGKTVGGVSGALSKMTGTLGQGFAKLTFDDEYQRARKVERMQNKSVGQSLAYGGQQLVTGLFDGVTGIVRKPVEGAQKEGVEGFFKGLGIGLVGVVTRPTAGVVDFASTGLDTIRRVADAADELKRLRPPRLILIDAIIRPYLYAESEANSILIRIEKGRYKSDIYAGHLLLTKDSKRLLVITERGLLGLSRSDMLNQWDVDFNYGWADLRDLPTLKQEGILVPLKEKQKRLGFLTGQPVSRVIQISCDQKLAEEFVTKMQETKNRVS